MTSETETETETETDTDRQTDRQTNICIYRCILCAIVRETNQAPIVDLVIAALGVGHPGGRE